MEHDVLDVAFQADYDPDFNGPDGVPWKDVGPLVLDTNKKVKGLAGLVATCGC